MSSFETSYLGLLTQLIADITKNSQDTKFFAENCIKKLESSLRFESKIRAKAITLFEKELTSPKALDKKILKTKLLLEKRPDSAYAFIDSMFRVFTIDKSIDYQFEKDIEHVANALRISKKEFNKIRNSHLREQKRINPIVDISFYRILNCHGAESFEEIKKKYYALTISYHPDTRQTSRMSESEMDMKFQEIQIAYGKIKKAFKNLKV